MDLQRNKERIQKFKETGDLRYIYQKELDKACFQQLLIKYCVIKHLILLKIRNTMHIKGIFVQWFVNFLIEKLPVVILKMKIC